MQWAKTTRYQSSITVNRRTYNVLCIQDFDDSFAVYINKQLVTEVDSLPTEEELETIILENKEVELRIKNGYAAAGVYR